MPQATAKLTCGYLDQQRPCPSLKTPSA